MLEVVFIYVQDDGSPVSIFVSDPNQPPRRNLLPVAKNVPRKLRNVRHPDVLVLIDAVDTDSTVYIMTECVKPLGRALQEGERGLDNLGPAAHSGT